MRSSPAAQRERLDPRTRRTRRMLQEALAKLLKEKDFDQISIGDLAEESTLNRATFYGHYRDKFELLENLVEAQFQQLIIKRNIRFDGCASAMKNLAMCVCYYLSENVRPSEEGLRQASGPMETAIVSVVRRLIQDGFDRHPPKPGIPVEILSAAIAWAIYGVCKEWVKHPKRKSVNGIAGMIEKIIHPILASVN